MATEDNDSQEDLIPDNTPFYANQMEDPQNAHYLIDLWLSSSDDEK